MAGCDPQTARFAPIPENLAPARSFISNYVQSCRWAGSDLDVVIAIGEILQNIIRHGFSGGTRDGRVVMTVKVEEQDVLVVTIEDTAPSTIPAEWSNNGREAHEGGPALMRLTPVVRPLCRNGRRRCVLNRHDKNILFLDLDGHHDPAIARAT